MMPLRERSAGRRATSRRRARDGSLRDRCDALRRGRGPTASRRCRRRAPGTAACSTIGPPSSSDVTRCTVAPVTRHAVLERLPLRVEAGKRRQQRRVDVQDAIGKRVEQRRADQTHEAGEADEIDVPRLAAAAASAAIVGVAIGVVARVQVDASRCRRRARAAGRARRRGSRSRPRSSRRAARSATASMIDWRLLPRPEIRTPSGGRRRSRTS